MGAYDLWCETTRVKSTRITGIPLSTFTHQQIRIAETSAEIASMQMLMKQILDTARIEGAGKGTGTYFVSSDGTYLGGDWQLRSALTISGAFTDEPLPITITQTTKVTSLE